MCAPFLPSIYDTPIVVVFFIVARAPAAFAISRDRMRILYIDVCVRVYKYRESSHDSRINYQLPISPDYAAHGARVK